MGVFSIIPYIWNVYLIKNLNIMKKLVLLVALVCTSVISLANNVIVSSCGTSVYIAEDMSPEELLEIYDALEAACEWN